MSKQTILERMNTDDPGRKQTILGLKQTILYEIRVCRPAKQTILRDESRRSITLIDDSDLDDIVMLVTKSMVTFSSYW